jgi:diguanylate cyclase (GGDEF)-like protein
MIVLLANCAVPPLERARLQRLAVTDPLTLAFNQRYLGRRLQEEIERARRYGLPLSVLLLDLDWFKQVNDAHGHSAGDLVLRVVADRVRASVRRMDVLVRRGGDEFLLIMPHTRREHAGVVAERIRRRLGTEPVELAGSVRTRVTASIGIAGWDGREAAEILEQRADAAMYDAKQQGRDTISESPSASWPPPH